MRPAARNSGRSQDIPTACHQRELQSRRGADRLGKHGRYDQAVGCGQRRGTQDAQRTYSDVNSVSFSPDGARIASASEDGTIKLWDATSGEELRTLKGHTDRSQQRELQPRRGADRLGEQVTVRSSCGMRRAARNSGRSKDIRQCHQRELQPRRGADRLGERSNNDQVVGCVERRGTQDAQRTYGLCHSA